MSTFQELYDADISRYTPGKVPGWNRKFHYYLRKTQTCRNRLLKTWYHLCFRIISDRHRMEISHGALIGKGFCLRDPFTITVNSNAVIGEDVTFGKNVTIGKQNRGALKGTPTIGNRVCIEDNAVIVGKIRIGDDVRISANAYVNRDIPDHAFVSGNPGMIITCQPQNESRST